MNEDTEVIIKRTKTSQKIITNAIADYRSNPTALTEHRLTTATGYPLPPLDDLQNRVEYSREMPKQIPLREVPSATAQKSLGQWYQANGKYDKVAEIIESKNRQFVSDMGNTDLSPAQIWLALTTKHMPAITYMFYGSSPSPEFLEKETNFLITSLLPHLNLNRHTPIAIRHSPTSRLGLELPHLHCEAGIIHIKQWIKHIRNDTSMGKEMLVNLEWLQLHEGTSTSIYVDTTTNLPHLFEGRTQWLRHFLHCIQGQLLLEQEVVPHRNCYDEPSIMDVLLSGT